MRALSQSRQLHLNATRLHCQQTYETAFEPSSRPRSTLVSLTSRPSSQRWLSLQASDINYYAASQPPAEDQLKDANAFFTKQPPILLFSSPTFRLLPASHHPEVTFLGRSNVGKSSLINSLFARHNVALTSKKPGKTRLMNAFGVSPHPLSAGKQSGTKGEIMDAAWKRMRSGLLLVDMPGYGHASRANWGDEIVKYLRQRKQLRRVFMLIDSEHGLKSTDKSMLEHLVRDGVPHSLILSKVDKLFETNGKPLTDQRLQNKIAKVRARVEETTLQLQNDFYSGRSMAGDVLCVSSRASLDNYDDQQRQKIGIGALRQAILSACALDQSDKSGMGMNVEDIKILDE